MKLSHVLVAFAASAPSATAQQVVFQDGFENGLANWTATGLWNLEASTDTCGFQAAPFPEGTQAAWYGHLSFGCNYSTGTQNSGQLELSSWIQLPLAMSVSLHFWMSSETEYCYEDRFSLSPYDRHFVYVLAQGGANTTVWLCPQFGSPGTQDLPWHERRMDLSAYRGQLVRVGFAFDTSDEVLNDLRGWYVDDVRILAEPGSRVCPGTGFDSGCPCVPWYLMVAGGCRNSTTQSAVMYTNGSVSVAADTLQVRADHMPSDTIALLSQSSTQGTTVTFGDGVSCTGGTMIRLGIVQASSGVATWPPSGTPSISQRGLLPPGGGIRYYSVLYRDAPNYCTPATFNATETQRIQWVP